MKKATWIIDGQKVVELEKNEIIEAGAFHPSRSGGRPCAVPEKFVGKVASDFAEPGRVVYNPID